MLLLHRHLSAGQVHAGVTAPLAAGSTSPDVVAIEARKATGAIGGRDATAEPVVARPRRSAAKLVTLAARQAAQQVPDDARPAPSVADYDQLLSHTSKNRSLP